MNARAIPYTSWVIDLVTAIAGVYHWTHDYVMRLRPCAAFMYAMKAEAERWQRIEDQRQAASYHALAEQSQRNLIERINCKLSGPGVVPKFDDCLSEVELEEARKARAEHDELYRRLESQGLLLPADGNQIALMMERG